MALQYFFKGEMEFYPDFNPLSKPLIEYTIVDVRCKAFSKAQIKIDKASGAFHACAFDGSSKKCSSCDLKGKAFVLPLSSWRLTKKC